MIQNTYKILLLGWYGYSAIGDDLMAEVTRGLFFEEAEERQVSLQFVPTVNSFKNRLIQQYLSRCDLIVIGGGSILGFDTMDLYFTLFGFDRLNLGMLSRNRKTPLAIFGSGYRREKEELSEKDRCHMRKIFDGAFLKGVRGPVSQGLFITNGIADEVEVIGDPAVSFSPVSVEANPDGNFNVGMNVRFIKSDEPQYLDNEEIHGIFAELADHFIEEGAHLYFFSFTENRYDSDTEAAKRVMRLMKYGEKAELIPFSRDAIRRCSIIGRFDHLISQRLHPSILGWVQKAPNIGFEYQFLKTSDFMKSIGMDEYVIRTDEYSLDAYLNKYERMKQNRQEIVEQSQRCFEQWRNVQRKFIGECMDIMVG